MNESDVRAQLAALIDPNTGRDFITDKAIKAVTVRGSDVHVEVVVGYPAASQHWLLKNLIEQGLRSLPGVGAVQVEVSHRIISHAVQRGVKLREGIRNIIAVASGKGGVGKSTTAVNLALALAQEGARVGILDADIYGPSLPRMLGLDARPESLDGKSMEPLQAQGLQAMSIGFLVDVDTPMVWRGPMVTGALEQLLNDTRWKDLDYLVVDMPPGTGDVQLTLSQKVPVTGAVIVTTPQEVAVIDARKGLRMFEKVGIPIIGVVENMSTHVCSNCGHEEPIFGTGGAQAMCRDYNVPFLGGLPLDGRIRALSDDGTPVVAADPGSPLAATYREIARRVAVFIAQQSEDHSAKFPTIKVVR